MVGQGTVIRLSRDSTNTPWGFRLQGGQETQCPLTVQRVFVGGVSDGQLHRGDVIVGIEGHDAVHMYHSQAEELIKGTGRQLTLNVRRGDDSQNGIQSPQQYHSGHSPLSPQYGGSDHGGYNPSSSQYDQRGRHEFGRSHLGAGDEDEDYSRSVGDIKKMFNRPPAQPVYTGTSGIKLSARPGSTSYTPKRPVFSKPPPTMAGDLAEPGWVPKNKPYPHSPSRYGPARMNSPPVNRRQGDDLQSYRAASQPIRHEPAEKPAWLGTLRSSGGPRMWELQEQEALVAGGPKPPAQNQRQPVHAQSYPGSEGGRDSPVVVHNPRVQAVRYGPGGDGPVYEQHDPDQVQSDTARVAHLQYNTPIGLYSKANALDALKGQTRGKPGDGTLQITGGGGGAKQPFNPSVQSDVYRLIKEEEEAGKHGGGGRPASGPSGGSRRPAPQHYAPPPQPEEEPHSSRYYQLINENNDQLEEYVRMPHHTTAYAGGNGNYGGSRGGGVNTRHGDTGISDF